MIEIIDNFFTNKELDYLNLEMDKGSWKLNGYSNNSTSKNFWFKDIINTEALTLFTNKIQHGIGHKIVIDHLYVNGQAHGQCGEWHIDNYNKPAINCFTIVYFLKEWLPEYGGHLLIKTSPITSILPEFNKAVLFDGTFEHVGLEPTMHCKSQRESIGCKFRVID